jgi:preprotein translocase subunit SecD
MRRNNPWILAATAIVLLVSIYLITPDPQVPFLDRQIKTYLGLDLVGGIQTLLEADLPASTNVDPEAMRTARQIIENRVNALGVSEAVVQLAGTNRIVVELPGVDNPEQAVATIRGTALMEWVDLGQNYLPPGTIIKTNLGSFEGENQPTPDPSIPLELLNNEWKTILTGAELVNAFASADELGNPVVSFELNETGAQIFAAYTSSNVGSTLAIVLDKQIISAPQVNTP